VSAAEVVAGGSAMRRSAQSPRLNFFGIGITDTDDEHHHDIWYVYIDDATTGCCRPANGLVVSFTSFDQRSIGILITYSKAFGAKLNRKVCSCSFLSQC
jgi:hypothetical protein